MGIDVETPPPPDLTGSRSVADYDEGPGSGDFRREELETALADGAWDRGFEEWAAHAAIDERDELVMTPGPTALPPEVREAMARPLVNPDVEAAFTDFYRDLLEKLAGVYGTDDEMLVLGGEGMLGLEASVASLVAPGDDVLCLANGLFGAGFADFVEMHGGDPTTHEVPAGTDRTLFDFSTLDDQEEQRSFRVRARFPDDDWVSETIEMDACHGDVVVTVTGDGDLDVIYSIC